jgi:beta-glucosidase-like glycosyl hydrolase
MSTPRTGRPPGLFACQPAGREVAIATLRHPLASQIWSAEHQELARQAVQKSLVLLKNDGVLPLDKTAGLVAALNAETLTQDSVASKYWAGLTLADPNEIHASCKKQTTERTVSVRRVLCQRSITPLAAASPLPV